MNDFIAVIFIFIVMLFLIFVLFILPVIALIKLSRLQTLISAIDARLERLAGNLPQEKKQEVAPPEKTVTETETKQEKQTQAPPSAPPVKIAESLKPEPPPAQPLKQETPVQEPEVTPAIKKPEVKHEAAAVPEHNIIQDKISEKLDSLEARTNSVFSRIWNWICVGEEFRQKNVSAEYAVATTWLIRAGIVILLFGIGFFLKYSMDRNWVSPAIRVSMMVLTGLALVSSGIKWSGGKYRPLFIGLAGAGFVTLYLSVMAAFRLYDLIDAVPAFALMVLITAAAMAASAGMNALLPALLGCIGGYLTPVFISTGSNDLTALLGYMTILSAGTLVVAKYRNWPLLHLGAQIFYSVIAGIAICRLMTPEFAPWSISLLCVNYIIFSLPPVIRTAKRRNTTILELVLLVLNVAFLLGAAVPAAREYYADIHLPACISFFAALVPFAEVLYVRSRMKEEKILQIFLLVITSFSIALTVPLLLNGAWVVAAWSVMAFLLVFTAVKTDSRTLMTMAYLLYFAAFLHGMAHGGRYGSACGSNYTDMLLDRLLSFGVYIFSMAMAAVLMFTRKTGVFAAKQEAVETPVRSGAFKLGISFAVTAGIIFFACSSCEFHFCMRYYVPWFARGVLVTWWSVFAFALIAFMFRFRLRHLLPPAVIVFIMAFCVIAFRHHDFFPYNEEYLHILRSNLLTMGVYILSLTLSGVLIFRFSKRADIPDEVKNASRHNAMVFLSAAGFLFFMYSSWEIFQALKEYVHAFRNGGVSVWWGLFAFTMLFSGIRHRVKAMRILAMTLFSACALKIFFIDLSGLEQIWRIVAFAATGILMIVGAALYIRFRDQFTDIPDKTSEKETGK